MGQRLRRGSRDLLKELNRSLILNEIQSKGVISRAGLARVTGLNKATVSTLVKDLISEHLVEEVGEKHDGLGRPPILLKLNPRGGCIVGVEVGYQRTSVVLTDLHAHVLDRWSAAHASETRKDAALAALYTLIDQALQRSRGLGYNVLGVGVGVPGMVNYDKGVLAYVPGLHWFDLPLQLMLTQRFELPIHLDNAANAGAMGERYFGVASAAENFIYLTIGDCVGAGIVCQGALYRGSTGFAGEVGHMVVDPRGPRCVCGARGCWETLVSPDGVLGYVGREITRGKESIVPALAGGDLSNASLRTVVEAAGKGDVLARRALQKVAVYLGLGIANLVHIFNPELVVIGGSALEIGPPLLRGALRTMQRQDITRLTVREASIVYSELGDDAGAVGAACLVLHEVLNVPQSIA